MPQDNAAAIKDLAINASRNLEYNQEIIMQWNMAVSLLCFKIVKFNGKNYYRREIQGDSFPLTGNKEKGDGHNKTVKPVINE